MRWVGLLSMLWGCASEPESPRHKEDEQVSLNALFAGIEQGCSTNPVLAKALASMVLAIDHSTWKPSHLVEVPSKWRGIFSSPRLLSTAPTHSIFAASANNAVFYGFHLVEIRRLVGHQNGANGFVIVVAGKAQKVRDTLHTELQIVDSCHNQNFCDFGPFELIFEENDMGQTEIICDTST